MKTKLLGKKRETREDEHSEDEENVKLPLNLS